MKKRLLAFNNHQQLALCFQQRILLCTGPVNMDMVLKSKIYEQKVTILVL